MKTRTKMIFATVLFSAGMIAPAIADSDQWISIGKAQFHGRYDRDAGFPGWRGRRVDTIALKTNDFAQCSRVRVTFGNGHTRDLNSGGLRHMVPGQFYRLDLPGDDRNVVRIAMSCHSLVDRGVTVEVVARK